MQRLNVEANSTLRRIREFTVREGLNMGDDLDSGTLPTTVSDLLRRVLQKFEREESPQSFTGSLDFDPAYPEVFFLMVKWYWKAEDLGQQLLEQFQASCRLAQAEGDTVAPAITRRKWAVARAIRYWQWKFPEDFKVSSDLQQVVLGLQQLMKQNSEEEMATSISLDTIPVEKWLLRTSLAVSTQGGPRKSNLSFDATSAREFAEIICSLDYKLFRRIPFQEFCIYAHCAKPTDDTPRIDECIQLFNGTTTWVVSNILREFTMVKRAAIIVKFIECTRHLFDLHAFNTLLAVVGGLNHFSIRRLSQTWAKVDKLKRDELEHKTDFFSSESNFTIYRQQVVGLNASFHIPVLGIVLKDLVAIDIQAKDMLNPAQGILNMNKFRNLWKVLSAIRSSQVTIPLLTPDLDRMRVLRAAINHSHLTDEALEELSEAREPRQKAGRAGGAGSNQVKNALPKFSSWAGGQQPQVDSVQVTKHVKQMVDAVFKVYDTDQSGTISYKEFETISSNFPFIECFSVLDQDNDGTISYEEMLQYFLSANSLLRERFTHRFEEHTFLGTTVCEHCKGMMKGIVKQGVRCRDCAIACHKYCKDHVVVDCTKRKERKSKKRESQLETAVQEPELYCDDDSSLKERLQRAEEARDALLTENAELQARLAEANAKVQELQAHIGMIRQHTIGFILEQMNTLNPETISSDV